MMVEVWKDAAAVDAHKFQRAFYRNRGQGGAVINRFAGYPGLRRTGVEELKDSLRKRSKLQEVNLLAAFIFYLGLPGQIIGL